jgi:hypothetical protein
MRRQNDLAIGERVEESSDDIREACHRASDGPLSINPPRARALRFRQEGSSTEKRFPWLESSVNVRKLWVTRFFEHEHEHEHEHRELRTANCELRTANCEP